MIQPGTYDILIQKNADFDLSFRLEDGSSNPVDLTGATVEAQIWTAGKTSKLADFTVTVDNPTNGAFTIALTDTQTQALSSNGYYDIRITAGSISDYWVRGSVTLATGFTE